MSENNSVGEHHLERELEAIFDKDIIELIEARLTSKGTAEVVNIRLNDFVKKALIDKAVFMLKEKVANNEEPNALEFIGILSLMDSAYLLK